MTDPLASKKLHKGCLNIKKTKASLHKMLRFNKLLNSKADYGKAGASWLIHLKSK